MYCQSTTAELFAFSTYEKHHNWLICMPAFRRNSPRPQSLNPQRMAHTQFGDLYYVCPRVARKHAVDSKYDRWARGGVMHELMTLKKPNPEC